MSLFQRIVRWLFAIGCIGLAIFLVKKGIEKASITGSFFPILGAMVLILSATIVVIPELLHVFTRPLFALVDSIFFPGGKLSRPVLSYTLPEFYLKQRRFDDALDEFRKILRHYPNESKAYVGALEILLERYEEVEEEAARELYAQAKKRLRDHPEDLAQVEACWHRLTGDWIAR